MKIDSEEIQVIPKRKQCQQNQEHPKKKHHIDPLSLILFNALSRFSCELA